MFTCKKEIFYIQVELKGPVALIQFSCFTSVPSCNGECAIDPSDIFRITRNWWYYAATASKASLNPKPKRAQLPLSRNTQILTERNGNKG